MCQCYSCFPNQYDKSKDYLHFARGFSLLVKKTDVKLNVYIFIGLLGSSLSLSAQGDIKMALEAASAKLAENKADEAINILGSVSSENAQPKFRSELLSLLGEAYLKKKDFKKSLEFLDESLALDKVIFNRKGLTRSLYLKSRTLAFSGDFQYALESAQQGAYIARARQDHQLELQLLNIMSWAQFETQVDFNAVLTHEARVIVVVQQTGSPIQKADVYNNLGYDLTVAGIVKLDSAIALMQYANQTYARQAQNQGRWYTLMNLTWQYRLKNDLNQSMKYGEMAVAQAKADDDRHAIVESCFQLAETLIEAGKTNTARPYYEMALKRSLEKDDRDKYVFDIYYGRYLWEIGKNKEAIDRLQKAVEFLTTSEVFYEMHGRALLASYYFEQGEIDKADAMLHVIENPRHNYIAFETRFMAACTRARILQSMKKPDIANALLQSWMEEAEYNQSILLLQKGKQTLKDINN